MKTMIAVAALLLTAGRSGAAPSRKTAGNLFTGNYGYLLQYPATHTAIASFDDPEKTMERVLIFPPGTPREKMGEENYAKYGIVRVEVAPIMVRAPQGTFRAGLKELLVAIPETLKQNGEKYTVEKYPSALPGAKISIMGRTPLVQVVLEGKKVTYIFTAGKDGRLLRDLIKSLKEAAPTDRPGI